jgi:hypothetical protein
MKTLAFCFCAALASAQNLTGVQRVYVERLTGGAAADQIRELVIASLHNSRVFTITEDPDRADAILRGAADDVIYTEQFQARDGVDMRVGLGSGTRSTKAGSGLNLSSRSLGVTVGDDESIDVKERKHEAMATVRLVNKDGDVIWSTTQESAGGKFRGASADVAEKVTRRLTEDMAKAREVERQPTPSSTPSKVMPPQ